MFKKKYGNSEKKPTRQCSSLKMMPSLYKLCDIQYFQTKGGHLQVTSRLICEYNLDFWTKINENSH